MVARDPTKRRPNNSTASGVPFRNSRGAFSLICVIQSILRRHNRTVDFKSRGSLLSNTIRRPILKPPFSSFKILRNTKRPDQWVLRLRNIEKWALRIDKFPEIARQRHAAVGLKIEIL